MAELKAVDLDEMLDAKDIARMFHVSLPRAYAMLASGELPVIKIGRSVRVPRRKLESWIDEKVESGKST
jgi:excisionase family DNA binding protein